MIRLISLTVLVFCIGCGSPTKIGQKARVDAHERMDVVNADLAAQQAQQQFEVGQLDDAITTIRAAIARYPSNAGYHLLEGRILVEQHQLDKAMQSFYKVIDIDSNNSEAYYFLGILHQRWSEDNEALAHYQKAMECNDSHPQYIMAVAETMVALGELDDAIEILELSTKKFQHQPAVSTLLGHIYLQRGNPQLAASCLTDAILLGESNIEILQTLASAQFHAAQYGDCLMTLDSLEVMRGELTPYYKRVRAKCWVSTGQVLKGRDLCLEVTRETPNEVMAWIDLGYIAWEMGDYQRLHNCGNQVYQLNPRLQEGQLFTGISLLHLGSLEEAMGTLSRAKSYNKNVDFSGLLALLNDKNAKTKAEISIRQNVPPKSAETAVERHSNQASEVAEIVIVDQETALTP